MFNNMGNKFVWFVGVVEDRNDPKKLGRLRVRIFGIHTNNKSDIPIKDLPWAYPVNSLNSASMNGIGTSPTGPVEGTHVVGFFADGDSKQEPLILGTVGGIPQESDVSLDFGFQDPTGTYPKFFDEPDTNRLSRNEKTEETVLQVKKDSLNIENPLPSGSWNEPPVPYNSQYPFNHVRETESGHIKEYDDTKGSERIHEYHKAGTFYEIHPDGSKVEKIVGNGYKIVLKDNNVLIKGDCNVTIEGNANVYVGGNLDAKVLGRVDLDVVDEIKITSESNILMQAPRIDFN